jgi:hypothetical protein
MKTKTTKQTETQKRKFKINDKVRLIWPKQDLENFDLNEVQIIRRFNNDYDVPCYYVNSYRSLPLWLVKESDIRKASKI